MKTILIYLTVVLLCFNVHAGQLQVIVKGAPAPYDGYVIDKDQEKIFRGINEKSKLYEAKIVILKDLQVNRESMVAFHRNRADSYAESLRKEQTRATLGTIAKKSISCPNLLNRQEGEYMKTQSKTGRIYNCEEIGKFKDLMNEITWSWEYPTYDFIKTSEGYYNLNKLTIGPDFVDYKTDYYPLAEGVFEQLELFYSLLENS
jgi:hypothetical protein